MKRSDVHALTCRLITMLALGSVIIVSLFSQTDELPRIVDPVSDQTNTLSTGDIAALRQQILQFEDSTSNQIAVLMIPSLDGNDIRDLGIRILEKSKLGQKGKDNGVLILIAKDDRLVGIEVGYGLEGAIPDAVCDQIIRNEVRPLFREGKYYEGISAAITSIAGAAKGEYSAETKKKKKNSGWLPVLLIIAVIVVSVVSSVRRRKYSISSHGHRGYNNWWWGGGGFGGGGGGFGSFGGGSGGGGGWSAGGGSFGGGGASGSW